MTFSLFNISLKVLTVNNQNGVGEALNSLILQL